MDTRRTIRLTVGALALACGAALAGNAFAQTPDVHEMHKVTIKYGDLNLTTDSGARTLYQRIRGAARFVCGEEGRGLDEQRQWQGCYHTTVDDAVSAVHSPLLSAIYRDESAKPQVTAMLAE